MKKIRPISDLRNNFAEVSREVHEHNEPVFFTKNGCGDMVVMSMEAYENLQFESEIYYKLLEVERFAGNYRIYSCEIIQSGCSLKTGRTNQRCR
ncbi:MAG: type II toxin-antitoxin system Phd/YefM family antitoxin [Firmicutes bacterium]|nr:type II toxin-antitoxin system Phd/YefM family antitoxin [Bacillota bacterium]